MLAAISVIPAAIGLVLVATEVILAAIGLVLVATEVILAAIGLVPFSVMLMDKPRKSHLSDVAINCAGPASARK